MSWAPAVFLGVGKLGVWGRKSLSESRDGTPVGAKAPEADHRL